MKVSCRAHDIPPLNTLAFTINLWRIGTFSYINMVCYHYLKIKIIMQYLIFGSLIWIFPSVPKKPFCNFVKNQDLIKVCALH